MTATSREDGSAVNALGQLADATHCGVALVPVNNH
jgi:hypothetical protein